MIPEEISRERGPEKFELLKMSSDNLEFPVKMWLHRKIKCKFKTTVRLIICNNDKKEKVPKKVKEKSITKYQEFFQRPQTLLAG